MDELEAGLKTYREAARKAPGAKKSGAYREGMLVEQMVRTPLSTYAILAFEDLRFGMMTAAGSADRRKMLDEMVVMLKDEIARTDASLEAVRRHSRFGYEMETDDVYDGYGLEQKLGVMQGALDREVSTGSNTASEKRGPGATW
ncbi:MAG TPA: hypothetical protein VM120_07610 [Bryobacteraceae bacterium]|nr:hypothetical protein [Bryobacteraceae bacterium]